MQTAETLQHRKQREFCDLATIKDITLFAAGLQSGKTLAGVDCIEELLYIHKLQLPPQIRGSLTPEVWVLAPSYKLVKVAKGYFTWRLQRYIYSDAECRRDGLKREDANTLWLKPMDREDGKPIRVVFRTTSDPDDLRGTGYLLVALWDEAAYGKDEAWRVLQTRMIASRGKILLTTSPRGKNWVYHEVYLPATADHDSPVYDPRIGVVHCRSIDNPWADKNYIQTLARRFGKDYADQELNALFVQYEGYVYDFDKSRHITHKTPEASQCDKIVWGVDPGFSDPYAVVMFGRWNRVWYQLDELYVTKRTTDELIPLFREKAKEYEPRVLWCDKRRPSDIRDLRRAGFDARPALEPHAEDDRRTIMPGIRKIQTLLDGGRLYVAPRCEFTIEEYEKYAYKDVEDKNRGEVPADWMNHAMDATRYALVSEEGINHEEARPRYQSTSVDGVPRPRGRRGPIVVPTVADSLAMQDNKWEAQEKLRNRTR